jgi:hypothetical protein
MVSTERYEPWVNGDFCAKKQSDCMDLEATLSKSLFW